MSDLPIDYCPLCNYPKISSQLFEGNNSLRLYHCPNCGEFSVGIMAYRYTSLIIDSNLKALVSYYVRKNSTTENPVILDNAKLEEIKKSCRLPSTSEQSDNLLQWFLEQSESSYERVDGFTRKLPALIGAKNQLQIINLLDQLSKDNFIEMETPSGNLREFPTFDNFCGHLTSLGLQKLERSKMDKSNIEYNFKKYQLSEENKIWLSALLGSDFNKIDEKSLKVRLKDKLPQSFDPTRMDRRLCIENRLTLFGLWLIKPNHPLISISDQVINIIKSSIENNPSIKEISSKEIAESGMVSEKNVQIVLAFLNDMGFLSGGTLAQERIGFRIANFYPEHYGYDKFIYYKNLDEEIEKYFNAKTSASFGTISSISSSKDDNNVTGLNKNIWDEIKADYGVSKQLLGKKLKFITPRNKKEIIFRDIGHAYYFSKNSFPKPAIILAGGIIEEILKSFLEFNDIDAVHKSFNQIIALCESKELIDIANIRLSDSIRYFRNLVHIDKEYNSSLIISNSMAVGAVSSIFTIVNSL